MFKTLKNILKNLAPHVSVHIYDHLPHEPPEDGRKYLPKHMVASFFLMF